MPSPSLYSPHVNGGGLVHNSSEVDATVIVPADCVVPELCKIKGDAILPAGIVLRIVAGQFSANYAGTINGVHQYAGGCLLGTYDEIVQQVADNPTLDGWETTPAERDKTFAVLRIIRKKYEGA